MRAFMRGGQAIRMLLMLFLLFVRLSAGLPVCAGEEGTAAQNESGPQEAPAAEQESREEELPGTDLLESMDFGEVQNLLDEMLGENTFSFGGALKEILSGKDPFSKEKVLKLLEGLLFSRFKEEKKELYRLLFLILLAAVFTNFAQAFDRGQIGEGSFYVVYLLLFISLINRYLKLSASLAGSLNWLAQFMQALAPAYFMAVAASVGGTTAAVFYEGVLLLVWLVQTILVRILLPGANLYILLCMVNHLSREEMLGKMAELLGTLISWSQKTMLGVVIGLQVVRNLVAPVMDSLKKGIVGKTAGALPGVGGAVNMVTELVVTSAVLVRNSMGAVVLGAVVLAGAGPALHLLFLSLLYRFLAALAQPVSDRRIVGCFSTMGEGCGILLKMMLTGDVLCMLVFLILAASFGGGI